MSFDSNFVPQKEVEIGDSAPKEPENGLLWFDTSGTELKFYNGSEWIDVMPKRRIQSLADAPSNPKEGDLWYETDESRMLFWNGSAWEEISTTVL